VTVCQWLILLYGMDVLCIDSWLSDVARVGSGSQFSAQVPSKSAELTPVSNSKVL